MFNITRPNDFRSPECFLLKLKIGYLFRKIARNRQIIVEFFFCVLTRTPKKEEQTLFWGECQERRKWPRRPKNMK